MHPAAVQLAKDVYEEYLKDKGYRFVAKTFRYPFAGGSVISQFRGSNSYNRDDTPYWSFQIDIRILFDDLEYDPQTWPVTWMFGNGPMGRYSGAGGLYSIEDRDETMPRRIAEDICRSTERLLAERDVIRAAFQWRIQQSKNKHGNKHITGTNNG